MIPHPLKFLAAIILICVTVLLTPVEFLWKWLAPSSHEKVFDWCAEHIVPRLEHWLATTWPEGESHGRYDL